MRYGFVNTGYWRSKDEISHIGMNNILGIGTIIFRAGEVKLYMICLV